MIAADAERVGAGDVQIGEQSPPVDFLNRERSRILTGDQIRRQLDLAPMSRIQVVAVGLAVLLSTLDGYDILAVTFAAPAITAAWSVGKAELGLVLSAGLAGMALGSFLLAPIGDLFGRKPLVLGSLVIMAAGMLMSARATSIAELVLWRVATGLGIGACMSAVNPLAAEFANARRRALSMSMLVTGYGLGGVIGGLAAALLLPRYGWQAVFIAGFAASAALLPIVAWLLPESISFLITRRHSDSLPRVNAVLARCGHAPMASLNGLSRPVRRGYSAVFAPGRIKVAGLLAATNFCLVLTVYFVVSWLPQMISDQGFAPSVASAISATMNLVGIAGGLALGTLARVGGLYRMTGLAVLVLAIGIAAFGSAPASLPLLIAISGILGFALFAGVGGSYAIIAATFEDTARATGTGFVLGVGRIGSALAPGLAGLLFASGLSRAQVSLFFSVFALIAGCVILLAGKRLFGGAMMMADRDSASSGSEEATMAVAASSAA